VKLPQLQQPQLQQPLRLEPQPELLVDPVVVVVLEAELLVDQPVVQVEAVAKVDP
jgi:hypothetical protein